ncbi:MAG: hypothetical protein ACO31E_12950 [Phycisphaerales bacterium]
MAFHAAATGDQAEPVVPFRHGDLVKVRFEENQSESVAVGFVLVDEPRYLSMRTVYIGQIASKALMRSEVREVSLMSRNPSFEPEAAAVPVPLAVGADKKPIVLEDSMSARSVAAILGRVDLIDRDVVLHLGDADPSDEDTLVLLNALHEARARRVRVFATFGRVQGNAAAIALACDAMIPVGDAVMVAKRRESPPNDPVVALLTALVAELASVDRPLSQACLGVPCTLAWSPEEGFTEKPGQFEVASPEGPARLNRDQLEATGLVSQAAASAEQAAALVAVGAVEPRGERMLARSRTNVGVIAKPDANAKPDAAKSAAIAAAIAQYNSALASVRADIAEFDLYFTGRKGVWTRQFKSLRAIWENTSEMTAHVNTQMAVSGLQKSMRQAIEEMENQGRRLRIMIDDFPHPILVEHRRREELFRTFKASLERNRAADYASTSAAVSRLHPLPPFGR